MQISIILVVLFSVFAVFKMLNHREKLKELSKNEIIFGFITYVGIYSVSLGLIAQLYDWLLLLDLNKYFKYGMSIIIIISVIIMISRILNKLLSDKLKKVFM